MSGLRNDFVVGRRVRMAGLSLCVIAICISLGIVGGASADPCIVPDNGTGTVTLPPQGCAYLSPAEVHLIIDGLPAGTTIELAPIHMDFICRENDFCSLMLPPGDCEEPGGSLGGHGDCFESTLDLTLTGTGDLAGFNRNLAVPIFCEVHTGPRNPGDAVQTFPNDMFRLQGGIFGDPDFAALNITAGTDNTLPSPGQTTLTDLGDGTFNVDSFFDIAYRIDFQGAPGSILEGMSGSTTATIHMETGQPPPELCPLPSPADDPCANLQVAGCLVDVLTDEQCRPTMVQIQDGQAVALECACISPGDKCGPIEISPGGDTITCPGGCPTPNPPGPCEIFVDANDGTGPHPSGKQSAPSAQFPNGTVLTCDCPGGGPPPDPHTTADQTVVRFNQADTPAIPADFFDPGSDPFTGTVDLTGGSADGSDTLIQRSGPVVCPGAPYPQACDPIDIEIVELNLVSLAPITVTFGSGADELWDVEVSLTDLGSSGIDGLLPTKTHPNGGRFDAAILVLPKMTFTKAGDPTEVRVLDYGVEGLEPIEINLVQVPFVINLGPHLQGVILAPNNNDFVPGVAEWLPGDPDSQAVVSATGISKGGGVDHTVTPVLALCPLPGDPATDPCGPLQLTDCVGSQNDSCQPVCVDFDSINSVVTVTNCSCVGIDECHVDVATLPPTCTGGCPAPLVCVQTDTLDPLTGFIHTCCTCEQSGACCDGTTGICTDNVPQSQCVNSLPGDQFTWYKGLTCADPLAVCVEHTGACCDHAQPGGSCVDGITESGCLNASPPLEQPEWFKDLTCADVEADSLCDEHTGACCDNTTGTCLGVMTESQCLGTPPPALPKFFKDLDCSQVDCSDGAECIYDNFFPTDPAVAHVSPSQKAVDFPYWAETVEDFILTGAPANHCVLDGVQFAAFHSFAGVSPANWDAVKITIYEDGGMFSLPKGPGGEPLQDTKGHIEYFPGGIKCEVLKVSMDKVTWVPRPDLLPDSYEVTVSGLKQFNCVLEKNHKYWIAISPEMLFNQFGGVLLYSSTFQVDHEAQLFFPANGFQVWTPLSASGIVPPTDLAIAIFANKGVQVGACCDGCSGLCTPDVPESACVEPEYCQPSWTKETACADVTCEEHTGACCDKSQPGGSCVSNVPESQCDTTDPQIQWYKGETCIEEPGGTIDCLEHTGACCDHALPGGHCVSGVAESACVPQGDLLWFTDKPGFDTLMLAKGKGLKGIETFEESNIPDGGKQILHDVLQGNVPNVDSFTGFGFPNGLTEKNLIIQTNITPGPSPPDPNPYNDVNALYVGGAGFIGSNSKKVGEDLFLQGIEASIDLIFTEPDKTGVGFDLSRFAGWGTGAGWIITVYDKSDDAIGTFKVSGPIPPEPGKTFVGVWSSVTIGRINIFDQEPSLGPEAIDNIQMWVGQDETQIEWFKDQDCVADGGTVNCAEHTGACCNGCTGVCSPNVPESACVEPVFCQPSWTKDLDCDAVECAEHTGACCDRRIADPTLRCLDNVPESQCPVDDPTQKSWTKDTLCADLDPLCSEHTGACCDHAQPGGGCVEGIPESQCVAGGGEDKGYKIQVDWTIPDGDPAGVRHEFFVPDHGSVADLDVDLLVQHPLRLELTVIVEHKETGTTVLLADHPGVPGEVNANIGNPQTFQKVFFDDEAGAPFDDVAGDNPIGNFRPTQPLSPFDGEDKFGWWSITVIDDMPGNPAGILIQWSLNFVNDGSSQLEWFKDMTCADVEAAGLCDEHTGACCDKSQPGGACVSGVPESQCNPNGDPQIQWYKGELCLEEGGTVDCAEHTGACCDGCSGGCTPDVPESACVEPDFCQPSWTKDADCSAVECVEHTGACCDGCSGGCTPDVPESACVEPDFCQPSWTKDAPCTAVECLEHTGACCDGCTGGCTPNVPESACVEPAFCQPSWTKDAACSAVECVEHTGACCDGTTGNCQDAVAESDCPVGANPGGIGACVDPQLCSDPCPAYGACMTDADCGDAGVCLADCIPSFCVCDSNAWACTDDCLGRCADMPDQYRWEKDTPCDDLVPPCTEHTGACCHGATGTCEDGVLPGDCTGALDQWFKDELCDELGLQCAQEECGPTDDETGCKPVECPDQGCFGECIDGAYVDNPNCCLVPGDCVGYEKNTKESIKMCKDCFGECVGGSYCDSALDPDCCIGGSCQCYLPNTDISIQLCGDCFGECVNGSYCDAPDPDCCIDPGACQCYMPTHPISLKLCAENPPAIPEECQARCVKYDPLTGQTTVIDCACAGPNDCRVDLSGITPGRGAGNDPCVVPDNGQGTVSLPPEGCDYLSPEEVHAIIDDLPAGVTIEFATIHKRIICEQPPDPPLPWCPPSGLCEDDGGDLGGKRDCFDSELEMSIDFKQDGVLVHHSDLSMLDVKCAVDTGPRTEGDPIQRFPTDMFHLEGHLFGDPDFAELHITAGTDFGLPSPGETTLVRQSHRDHNWVVDSFFDVSYQIDFVGTPTGFLQGASGSSIGTIHMATGNIPDCIGRCPPGMACERTITDNTDGTIDVCCDCVVAQCTSKEDCNDANTCTVDECDPNNPAAGLDGCVHTYRARPYGDVSPHTAVPPCTDQDKAAMGDGFANMLDVFCAFNAFNAGVPYVPCPCADVSPCPGDGFVNMLDVFAIFNAFNANPACPAPCP